MNCQYFQNNKCRSCEWIGISYLEQLAKKEALLREALSFASGFQLDPSLGSAETGFRNKAKLAVSGTSEKPILGLLGVDDLDQGREILHCPIHHPKLNEVIEALPAYIREFNLIPYQVEAQKGELKGVILFYSEESNQMYLRFVLRSKECVSRIKKLLPKLQAQFPFLVTVSANLQPIPHAILEGREEIIVSEEKQILHRLGSVDLKLSPQAFVQTNAALATKLYQTAANWIRAASPNLMVELFCGQGPFSFFAEKAAKKIIGFEVNEEAVKTANESAREQGLNHLEFRALDVAYAGEVIQSLSPDLLLVNPPRRGVGQAGVKLILAARPQHLVYSSCSVKSLSEDLKAISPFYELKRAQIFDLFPHTEHFETLVVLERK